MLYPLSYGRLPDGEKEQYPLTGGISSRPGRRNGPRMESSLSPAERDPGRAARRPRREKQSAPPRMRRAVRLAEVAGFEPAMGCESQTRLAGGRHRPD